ncbi:MAG: hypothetical protein KDI36_12390 [Pseudomonadales bacterium]|nr:hypothetical protein [Pseudomonadales bacterium]
MPACLAALLLLLTGCHTLAGFRIGELQEHTFTFDGQKRSYWILIPEDLPDDPVPMLTVLHGTGGDAAGMLAMGNFEQHARNNKYILVAPQSLGRAFNEGSGRTGKEFLGVDDTGFINALNAFLLERLNGDRKRNFLTGFSSGGAMTQRVALSPDTAFVAFAPVSGHLWAPDEEQEQPLKARHMLLIFGDSDPLNPLAGGPVNYGNGLVLDKPSQQATAEGWASRWQCSTRVTAQSDIVHLTSWNSCGNGKILMYHKIEGLGHFWAGGTVNKYDNIPPERVGPYQVRYITTLVIWDFFTRLPPERPPMLTIKRT